MSKSVVKWNEGLLNRMSIIIRRYIDQLKFAPYMAIWFITFFSHSFGSFLYNCVYGCIFCMFFIIVYMVVYFVCFV